MVCTLEGLAEPRRSDCVQENRCPNAGTLGTGETRSALTAGETRRFNSHESMTLFGHGISLLFPVEVRSSSASQARPGWLHNEPVLLLSTCRYIASRQMPREFWFKEHSEG